MQAERLLHAAAGACDRTWFPAYQCHADAEGQAAVLPLEHCRLFAKGFETGACLQGWRRAACCGRRTQ